MKARVAVIVGGVYAVVAMIGCNKASPPSTNPLYHSLDPAATGMTSIWLHYPLSTYAAEEETLKVATVSFVDTVRSCSDSVPAVDMLRMPALRCDVAYTLRDDTLRLLYWTESEQGAEHTTDFTDSTAMVRWHLAMVREGDGEGLVGAWRYAGLVWRLVRGELSLDERAMLDRQADSPDSLFGWGIVPAIGIQFTEDSLRVDQNTPGTAEALFGEAPASPIDTSVYAVTIERDRTGALLLSGDSTGVHVTIAVDSSGNITYTSNDTRYGDYTYYEDFRRCPNPLRPAWYATFLERNKRRR
jgi:hypothetical protein